MAQGDSQGQTVMSGVSGRYAMALFELAGEAKAIDSVEKNLISFNQLIQGSTDLQRLIGSPVFTADEQVSAISALLSKAKITGLAANFIKLVASKRRLFALPGMISAYRGMVAESKGIVAAEVTLAEAPTARQLEDIRAALKGAAGKDVSVEVKLDPAIIGGLIVKMGSRMVDSSLRTKLNSIRNAMKEVG
ncbi:MAG: F0F1 ATP synthase subunit delta [Bosea sp. (in: a-proteobacteria)]